MPPRQLNERQRRFAQLVHAGVPPYRAYPSAGYKPHHDSPYQLRENPGVKRYMDGLRKRALARSDVTTEKVLGDLQAAMNLAEDEKQPSSMIQASLGQAKVCGLIVDKHETRNIEDMDKSQVIQALREALGDKADAVLSTLGLNEQAAPQASDPAPQPTDQQPTPAPNAEGTQAVN